MLTPDHPIFQHERGFYTDLQRKNVDRAISRFEGREEKRVVTVAEPTLEEHFAAQWSTDGEQYMRDIENWRGQGTLEVLTELVVGEGRERAYIVDTSDVVVANIEDDLFFPTIGTCWAVVVDVEVSADRTIRAAYHLPGITANKDYSLGEFLSVIAERGRLDKMRIFYNLSCNKTPVEDEVSGVIPVGLDNKFVDMNGLDNWRAHDLYVRGGVARQFYNVGHWDAKTEVGTLDRVSSGKWEL